MLKKIQKKVEGLRVKVYAGQNNEDTEKCLYDIEQMIFKAMNKAPVSGSANDFEKELFKLINAYVTAGLSKPDLVHKMQYVTKSCEVS